MTNMGIAEARKNLPSIVKRANDNLEEFIISKDGKPQAVLMSLEEFEGWKETIEIMSDPVLMKEIEEGLDDIKHGRVTEFKRTTKDEL